MDGSYLPQVGISQTDSLTGDVIRTRKPTMWTKGDILTWRDRSALNPTNCKPSEIWQGVPLRVQQNVIGVMAVQSYTDPACYDQRTWTYCLPSAALPVTHRTETIPRN